MPNATIKDVLRKEGVRYLWKGNGVNCLRIIPQHAIVFATCRQIREKKIIKNKNFNNLLSGMIGGMTAMTCIYPFETIRSRLTLQTNKSYYNGITDAFLKIVKGEGFRGLYKGMRTSLYGFGAYSGLNFSFYHLVSSNVTFIDKEFEEKNKVITDFKGYKSFFKKLDIIIDQNERKNLIEKKLNIILKKKNLNLKNNPRLLEEVVDLTDQPDVIICEFDQKFLNNLIL